MKKAKQQFEEEQKRLHDKSRRKQKIRKQFELLIQDNDVVRVSLPFL